MTNNQRDNLDMFEEVIRFIEVDAATISATRAGLIAAKTKLKDLVTGIKDVAGKQTTVTGGSYEDKRVKKEALVQELLLVCGGTMAFASNITDNTLRDQMNYSVTDLRRINDETIAPFADNIAALVTPHLGAGLTGYGVTAAVMTALDGAKTAYETDKSKGRSATVFVATQTTQLPSYFNKAKAVLKNEMDPVALTLKQSQPAWYDQYKLARVIVNTGAGTTALSGDITETGTGLPIFDATVSITETGLPDIAIKSDVNGHYRQAPVKRGTKQVVITHSLYEDVALDAFEIKQGQTVVKNVVMKRKV